MLSPMLISQTDKTLREFTACYPNSLTVQKQHNLLKLIEKPISEIQVRD